MSVDPGNFVNRPDPDVFDADGTFSDEKAALIYERVKTWPPKQKVALLNWLKAAKTRSSIQRKYANVAELAHAVDPEFNITPGLELIGKDIEVALNNPRHNLLITMPPQEGKSSIVSVWTPMRALQLNPNRRIILASYGDDLAHAHAQTCRDWISKHGSGVIDPMTGALVEDKLGLKLKGRRVASWQIEGGRGGLVAVGLGSAITGRPADLLIIDDPFKNMQEADSAAHREKVQEWFYSVALTRLSPMASIILIQTRWHPSDLAGLVIEGEKAKDKADRRWKHLNIPAVAEAGIPDALGREPGTWLTSARGRTAAEFTMTRTDVGERVWYALYQGSPRNPKGGLFEKAWFEPKALPPANPIAAVVGVDPADSGEDDETGLIGAVLDASGVIVLTEDWSGLMTSDQWAKKAVQMALEIGAREIAMEAYATAKTYVAVLRNAWRDTQRESAEKLAAGEELQPWELRAAMTPDMPFTIYEWRGRGDAVGRASMLRQALEVRKCRTVDYKLNVFESLACDWQVGQHCPDRVSGAIIAHDRLELLRQGLPTIATPIDDRQAAATAPAWMTRRVTDALPGPFGSRGMDPLLR